MRTRGLAIVLMILTVCPVWAQQPQMCDNRPKVTVNGEAVVNVKPDKIAVSLGIETWDADIMAAKQKNNDILKETVAAIKEAGTKRRSES